MVVGGITTAHETLDDSSEGFVEGYLEVVCMVRNVAIAPVAVPESVGVVIEDIAKAALRGLCPGTAELQGVGDEPCAAFGYI